MRFFLDLVNVKALDALVHRRIDCLCVVVTGTPCVGEVMRYRGWIKDQVLLRGREVHLEGQPSVEIHIRLDFEAQRVNQETSDFLWHCRALIRIRLQGGGIYTKVLVFEVSF